MAHYANIDDNNQVINVIVADQEFIQSGAVGNPAKWIQTSYNTRGGVHYGANGEPDGAPALRKNYAGIGFTYDPGRDAFIPPKPYDSWTLDERSCTWQPPVPMPADTEHMYSWNEQTQSWDQHNFI